MTPFTLTYFYFQVILASLSFCFMYLYPTPIFSFHYKHFSNPTPTTVQCIKLQPFIHFTHTSPTHNHTYFHHIFLTNDVTQFIKSCKCLVSLSYHSSSTHPLTLSISHLTSHDQTVSFVAHTRTRTHILMCIFLFFSLKC